MVSSTVQAAASALSEDSYCSEDEYLQPKQDKLLSSKQKQPLKPIVCNKNVDKVSEESEMEEKNSSSESESEAFRVMKKILLRANSSSKRKRASEDENLKNNKSRKPTKAKPSKQGKKWSNCEINRLIELLEERSCLWDVFDKNYHIREIREKAVREIELELDTPVPEIKAKIMSLRSQLGREIAKMNKTKSGQSTSELYRPSWVFWERLQFLCPMMQPGKSRDNFQSQFCQGTFSENSTTPEASGIDNDDRDIGISKKN